MIGSVLDRCGNAQGWSAAALCGLLLVGCGSTQTTPALSADAASRMRSALDAVQASASAHDSSAATRELNAFAADVAAQHAAGHLASSDYAALQTGIARTRARITAEVTQPSPAAPAPTPATPVAPQPVTPVISQGPGKGKGKDNGKGHGKGNGGD